MPKISKRYHFCIDGRIVFSGSLSACQQMYDVVQSYWQSIYEQIGESYSSGGLLSVLTFDQCRFLRKSLPVYSIVLATSAGSDDTLSDQMII